jgi:lysophospholipase L1-like esterase
MKIRLLMGAATALAIFAALAATASAATTAQTHYYLALGDSLSAGYQPTANGGVGAETTQGYAYQLYNYEKRFVPNLKLVDLGCPGDTTTSLLTGVGNAASAKLFHCVRAGGSQLKAAVSFLKTHHARGEVPLVTIDVGANDVDGCATVPSSQLLSCVQAGVGTIDTNTPKILTALAKAAPKGAKLVGMNLYDPALDDWFLPAANPMQTLGEGSVALVQQVNSSIQSADTAAGFQTADVADAFHTYDSTDTLTYNGVSVPANVTYLCAWTWACTPPPVGPNIHANDLGYGVIAQAFEKVTGRL